MSGRRVVVSAAAVGVAVWLVAGAALFFVTHTLDGHQRRLFATLRRGSVETVGVLSGKDTSNHDSFTYTYTDQYGRTHTGGDSGEAQEQGDPANLRVGTNITVWYSPSKPSVSCYCTPSLNTDSEVDTTEVVISQFLAVGLGLGIGVGYVRRRADPDLST